MANIIITNKELINECATKLNKEGLEYENIYNEFVKIVNSIKSDEALSSLVIDKNLDDVINKIRNISIKTKFKCEEYYKFLQNAINNYEVSEAFNKNAIDSLEDTNVNAKGDLNNE